VQFLDFIKMINQEQIKELKQRIRIENYLASKGIKEENKYGGKYFYKSPLREEKTASFSVDTQLNTFRDFGNPNDKTTSIIDLVMLIDKVSFPDACKILEDFDGKGGGISQNFNPPPYRPKTPNNSVKSSKILEVKELSNIEHIDYLASRKISLGVAKKYLSEITYQDKYGRTHNAFCWKKDNGGYVAKNKQMKAPMKYIDLGEDCMTTIVVPTSKSVSVFESMLDFLSALEFYKTDSPKCTTIILNSTSNLDKAMPQLATAKIIHAYMDLDDNQAGQKATQKMKDAGLNVSDQSYIYKGYNDFNEFLTNR
jgi:hypothetical protein